MKLFNLINIADPKTVMIITGVRPDGSKVGYDFKNNTWMDNNILMNPDRLSNIYVFERSKFYNTIKRFYIVDFSTFNTKNIEAFKNIKIYKNQVVEITITLGLAKREIRREAFINKENLKRKSFNKRSKSNKNDSSNQDDINRITKELEEDFYQTQVLGIPLK